MVLENKNLIQNIMSKPITYPLLGEAPGWGSLAQVIKTHPASGTPPERGLFF